MRSVPLAIGLGAALLIGAALWLTRSANEDGPTSIVDETAATPASAAPPASTRSATPSLRTPTDGALATQAEADAYFRERDAFREALRAFVADGAARPDREDQAAELIARVRELEREGEVVAPQSLFLQAAILRAAYGDDAAALERRTKALKQEYDARRPPPSPPDPKFEAFKARERALLEDVLKRSDFPAGMSREAYLEQELAALQDEFYGQPPD